MWPRTLTLKLYTVTVARILKNNNNHKSIQYRHATIIVGPLSAERGWFRGWAVRDLSRFRSELLNSDRTVNFSNLSFLKIAVSLRTTDIFQFDLSSYLSIFVQLVILGYLKLLHILSWAVQTDDMSLKLPSRNRMPNGSSQASTKAVILVNSYTVLNMILN